MLPRAVLRRMVLPGGRDVLRLNVLLAGDDVLQRGDGAVLPGELGLLRRSLLPKRRNLLRGVLLPRRRKLLQSGNGSVLQRRSRGLGWRRSTRGHG